MSRTIIPSDMWKDVPVRVLNTSKSDVMFVANSPVSDLEPVEILNEGDCYSQGVKSISQADENVAPEFIKKLVEDIDPSVTES